MHMNNYSKLFGALRQMDRMNIIENVLQTASDIATEQLVQAQAKIMKGDRDFALDSDLRIEHAVKRLLLQLDPGSALVGEETSPNVSGENFWLVDPIDGTVNYSRRIPLFGICLAKIEQGVPVAAGICFPNLNEIYMAEVGSGAYRNGTRITVSDESSLSSSVVGFGDFATGSGSEEKNRSRLNVLSSLASRALRVRMLGSAALQMAWLSAGVIDASVVLSNKPWDVQAGALLVREAGGVVLDADGSEHGLRSKFTLSSSKALSKELVQIVQSSS